MPARGATAAPRASRSGIASAAAIGLHRVVWLGYADSGMTGWDQNSHEGAFAAAPVDEAGARFAAVLDDPRHPYVHRLAELSRTRA